MIRIAFLTTALFASTAAFAAPEDLDTDCALYNECAAAVPAEAEAEAEAEAAVDTGAKRAVRTSTNVRGGFTMRREPVVASAPARATAAAPKIKPSGQKAAIATARPKAAPGLSQRTEALRVAQQITFVSGSATLQPSSKQVADRLALSMLRPDKLSERFRIEGHTDAVGTRDTNLALSKRRAQAVADYLGTLGVDAKRLEIVGHGFDKPIDGIAKTSAANRRVVATVVK